MRSPIHRAIRVVGSAACNGEVRVRKCGVYPFVVVWYAPSPHRTAGSVAGGDVLTVSTRATPAVAACSGVCVRNRVAVGGGSE